jgi:hypothetical protein
MWNLLKNEVPVTAIDGIELHMRIENTHLTSLANQLLEKRNDRALSQIIGIFLEGQADYTQAARGYFKDRLDSSLKMLLIARQGGFK